MRRLGRDRIRQKLYYQRPEAKERRRLTRQRPENKEKKRVYDATRRQRPDIQEEKRAYRSLPDSKRKARAGLLRREYGMTTEAYASLLERQGGSCAICRGTSWGLHGPVVDHNHATGAVRGILCRSCNLAIGHLRDNPGLAMAVAEYLTKGECDEGH